MKSPNGGSLTTPLQSLARVTMYFPFDDTREAATDYLRAGHVLNASVGEDELAMSRPFSAGGSAYMHVKMQNKDSGVESGMLLVITGASGGGKTSLMAHLALKEAPSIGQCTSIYHFTGCNSRSTMLIDLLEHVYFEFCKFVETIRTTNRRARDGVNRTNDHH